jgi:hypothetical protein
MKENEMPDSTAGRVEYIEESPPTYVQKEER